MSVQKQTTFEMQPVAPFDFARSLKFLGEFMASRGEQRFDQMTITKAIRIDGVTAIFRVKSTGTVDAPCLSVDVYAEQPLSPSLIEALRYRVGFWLSVDDDLTPFYDIGRDDPVFAPVIDQLYGYHQVKFLTPYENATWSIMSSRTGMNQAKQIKQRFIDAYGTKLEFEGKTYAAFPEPHDLLGVSVEELEEVVGPMRRAEYIQSASRAFSMVDEAWLVEGDYDDVKKWLLGIKGIGEWGSAFILLRGLGRTERVPVSDARLMQQVSRRYGIEEDAENVRQLAKRYGAYQGYWAHYLRAAG